MTSEAGLEEAVIQDLSIIDSTYFLLGRQFPTDHGKLVDVLAMNADGDRVVIELKKGRSPRDAVAQLLDYASWAQDLPRDDVVEIFEGQNPAGHVEETTTRGVIEHHGHRKIRGQARDHGLAQILGSLPQFGERATVPPLAT